MFFRYYAGLQILLQQILITDRDIFFQNAPFLIRGKIRTPFIQSAFQFFQNPIFIASRLIHFIYK